jgi:hypothetical protein
MVFEGPERVMDRKVACYLLTHAPSGQTQRTEKTTAAAVIG